ncbi:MAG: HAMP domain-containing histidine kinase [Acidimicrobiales bacterium]|nr:HAMP domain-containing histidine kinase [Hyphomonadaceae bacterium]RZV44911.1 MAG: HAMP domain-containing histidine kinase [Acidimicrobiales bacterium]
MLAPIKRLLKNTVFRLSMIAAAMFAASSLVVLGYIYFATIITDLNQVDDTLQDELDELTQIYQQFGPTGLNREVIKRIYQPDRNVYYYFEHEGQKPTFNIGSQPIFSDDIEPTLWEKVTNKDETRTRKFVFVVDDASIIDKEPVTHRARGQFKVFSPKTRIFIARDVERIMATSEQVTRALLISIGLALTLGILSGIFVSKRFERRIEVFNKLARDIRAGDLKRRVPVNDTGDELDDLAGYLNDMLDHIDRLMQAMRYAGDSIAHDLRSPLTRLKTRLDSSSGQVNDKESQAILDQASEDVGELLKTFESVLRIARLEAGDKREMLLPTDPKPLLADIAELYEPSCEDAGLEFSMEIEGNHKINADRGLLSQAISNLVENAIKYTPRGGAITVRLRRIRSGRSEISITDTGPGIPPEERQRVKERFVRLEKSRTQPGSGLGLALVDAIADLHRAKFELTDGPGGEGSEMPGLRAAISFPRFKRS